MKTLDVKRVILDAKRQSNSYLITVENKQILIDPSRVYDLDRLKEQITTHTQIKAIDYIIMHGCDSLDFYVIKALVKEGFKGKLITTNKAFLNHEEDMPIDILTLGDFPNGLILEKETITFYHARFLPDANHFITYFNEAKILFSSHIASQSSNTVSDFKSFTESIHHYHEKHFPSIEFLRVALNKVKRLSLETIYPLYGKPISERNIKPLFKAILSYDFYNVHDIVISKQQKNLRYDYESICNHMLRRLENYYPKKAIKELFHKSEILLYENPTLEIQSTELKGYRLWNGFFEHIYKQKGFKWLVILEPLVKKYVKLYHIKMPTVYKTEAFTQQHKIEKLDQENYALSQTIQALKTRVDETLDKMLRCPITNLYNESVLAQHLKEHLDETLDKQDTRGLIILHIDNLNLINEKYGPERGDETLRNLVYILENIVHEGTLLFKQNGPGIYIYKHAVKSVILNNLVLNLRNEINKSTVFIEPITVSASIVTIDELNQAEPVGKRAESMIELTLSRLERAKRLGQGQVLDQYTDKSKIVEGSILLIDEDETYQNLMVNIFQRIDYQVIVAKDIYDAHDILRAQKISVIISEINLSKLDGFQLKHQLNATQSFKNIPFIIVSHHKNQEVIKRCNYLAVDLVLQKPIIPEELIGHVMRFKTKQVMH